MTVADQDSPHTEHSVSFQGTLDAMAVSDVNSECIWMGGPTNLGKCNTKQNGMVKKMFFDRGPKLPSFLSQSHDSGLSQILALHKALAESYTQKNSFQSQSNDQTSPRRPYKRGRAFSVDHGALSRNWETIHEDETAIQLKNNSKHHQNTGGDRTSMRRNSQDSGVVLIQRPIRRVVTETDLIKYRRKNSSETSISEESDYDDDDYGFRSYCELHNTFPSSTAMQKAKAPSAARRIFTKKWRKGKLQRRSSSTSHWSPEGNCTWTSVSGRKVTLIPVNLLNISDVERLALQKICAAKLQAMDLGCPITIPKDTSTNHKRSRRAWNLRRKGSSVLEQLRDRMKDGKESGPGLVFGISLTKCVANDMDLRRNKPSLLKERRESLDLGQASRAINRKSSSSSVGAISSDSMSESDGGKTANSNLLDALSLSSSSKQLEHARREQQSTLTSHTPHVPYVVNTCIKHLETYGLRVLGIFRIGSSKKRIKQLRDAFDTGKDVKLNEDHNPHDVAALLKEYFRDLPDPLLTRELYSAFIATRKLAKKDTRLLAINYLVSLLPLASRDTLHTLLKFLSKVVEHSTDAVDENGQILSGNKMDSHNLATLFGPNVLHKAKGGIEREFQVERAERAEERQEIIDIIQEMIDHQESVYELSAELHDEVIHLMQETNPDAVDYLLKKKSAADGIEIDFETSSSFYEESETSSIPQSPTSGNEAESGGILTPVSLSEALQREKRQQEEEELKAQQQQKRYYLTQPLQTHKHHPYPAQKTHPKSIMRVRSVDPPKEQTDTPPQSPDKSRPSNPGATWFKPDSQPPTPVSPRISPPTPTSPRISPRPKAFKPTVPQLSIKISSESQENIAPKSSLGRSPRIHRLRQRDSSKEGPSIPNTLQVPGFRSRAGSTSSSVSSYYPTSRSATNSPRTPDIARTRSMWTYGTESPPESPASNCSGRFDYGSKEPSPRPILKTSSTQRPLGINVPTQKKNSGESREGSGRGASREWQKDRWKHWERLAAERGDDLHEQETLV